MQENYLLIILFLLVIILMVLMAMVTFLLWNMLKTFQKRQPAVHERLKPSTSDTPKDQRTSALSLVPDPTILTCLHHPEDQAQGVCAISNDPLCERCIREHDGIIISFEHFKMFLAAEWSEVETILTTPDSTEASAHLYLLKQEFWTKQQTPSYISTHYKINVDEDIIESQVTLYSRKEDLELLQSHLEEYKSKIS